MNFGEIILLLVVYSLLAGCVLGLCRLVARYTKLGMFELPLVTSVVSIVLVCVLFNRNDLTNDKRGSVTEIFVTFARYVGGKGVFFAFLWIVIVLTAGACIAVLMLVFVGYSIIALFSKKYRARLVRTESAGGKKGVYAYYAVDNSVYQCVMSCKGNKLSAGKEYNVRFSRLLNKVFDKNALLTCAAGIFIELFGIAMFVLPIILLE